MTPTTPRTATTCTASTLSQPQVRRVRVQRALLHGDGPAGQQPLRRAEGERLHALPHGVHPTHPEERGRGGDE